MGQVLDVAAGGENAGENNRHQNVEDENVFLVPTTFNLSVRQLALMQEAGQQPGVPFCVTRLGAARHTGNVLRVNYVQNLVAIKRGSVRIIDEGSGKFSLSFEYDAMTKAHVVVHFGARDLSSASIVR